MARAAGRPSTAVGSRWRPARTRSEPVGPGPGGRRFVAFRVRYSSRACRHGATVTTGSPRRGGFAPTSSSARLQGLAIAITRALAPGPRGGVPARRPRRSTSASWRRSTSPGATGLSASAAARRADRHPHLPGRLHGRDRAAPRRHRLVLVDLHRRRHPVSLGGVLRARAGAGIAILARARSAAAPPVPGRHRLSPVYERRRRPSSRVLGRHPRGGARHGRAAVAVGAHRRCWPARTRPSSSRSRSAPRSRRTRAAAGGAAVRAELARARRGRRRSSRSSTTPVRRRAVDVVWAVGLAVGVAGLAAAGARTLRPGRPA